MKTKAQSQLSTTLSPDDTATRCAYLNTVRANFTACCQYPVIVIWIWQKSQCDANCASSVDPNRCCNILCNYRFMNVIAPVNNNANNFTYDPTTGLATAFMLSIGNDTRWTDTVTASVSYCVNAIAQQATYDSCGIPTQLQDIINCAYNEIFYRCPLWNLNNLVECDFTREYVDLCYRTKT